MWYILELSLVVASETAYACICVFVHVCACVCVGMGECVYVCLNSSAVVTTEAWLYSI